MSPPAIHSSRLIAVAALVAAFTIMAPVRSEEPQPATAER